MRWWLAAAAAVPLVASSAALAQTALVQPPAPEKPNSASTFKLPPEREFKSESPLQDGMIAEEEVAPDAHLNVGLAPMLGRNIHSLMIERELVPTQNPGVSFVIKFRG